MNVLLRLPPFALLFLLGVLLGILRFLLLLPFRRRVPLYAELRLEGPILWQVPPRGAFGLSWRRGPDSVEGVRRTLAYLATEPHLRGVVVSTRGLRGSLVRLQALADELHRFRASGKEVILYLREGGAPDLVLAAAADQVWLAPGGTLTLVGEAAVLSTARGLLDRLGIVPEFVRIGEHKTAPELFTHAEPSAVQREVAARLVEARYERVVGIVAGRVGDRVRAREVLDGGPYTSGRALEAGLVDALVYPDALAEALRARVGEGAKGPALLTAEEVLQSRRWRAPRPRLARHRILVVPIVGILRTGRSVSLPTGPRFVGEETVLAQIEAARRDPRVRGVVVVSDCRGGMASASDRVWHAVMRLAQEKPTAAYTESVAASGGYLAIAGAGRIFAAPGAIVGSIGVFAGRFAIGALLRRLGLHLEVERRGENAGLLTAFDPLRAPEREVLKAEIRQVYEEFVDRVARGRKREPEEIRALGEGRVFLAEEAPDALVDEIGDLRAAIAWVVATARLPAGSWEVRMARDRAAKPSGLPSLLAEVARIPMRTYWSWAADLPVEEGVWDARSGGRDYSENDWES